jgi:hypothetical protein
MVKGGDFMKKLLGCFLCLMLLAFGAQAHALSIDPGSTPQWVGNDTSQSVIDGIILPLIAPATELYKMESGTGGSESGALANNYTTAFNGDLSGATITWDGGDYVGQPAYLLVKDGNQEPAWYLFDLTGANTPPGTIPAWDGQETLSLSGFWPDNGAISHVSLYGTHSVPEPTTMLLFGSGILFVGAFGRKRFKK